MKELSTKKKPIRVLMQNRSTAFSHRGGDTVLMERLRDSLVEYGVETKVDIEMRENPADYDLVHLFNFALPELLEMQGKRAVEAGRPFVVSTLCEDIANFHNQSIEWGKLLFEYVQNGQDKKWYEETKQNISWNPCPGFPNEWIAQNAAALYTNGKSESDTIRREYGSGPRIIEVQLGHEIQAQGDPEMFIKQYGVKDFIFCVGRFETRKNQLMLLKALEDVNIPVVLAGGGFSYQPDYDWAVRNFKRKGETLILDRISPEMMASAYMACRIHVLASWYELPGLVSLEAARYGKNVVATLKGTAGDYMGDWAFYCDPSDWRSVQNAVLAAYYSPAKEGISDFVKRYTWDETARQTYSSYCDILGISSYKETEAGTQSQGCRQSWESMQTASIGQYDMDFSATNFQELLERGEVAAMNKDFELAKTLLGKAVNINPYAIKALRSLGAVHLANSDPETGAMFFRRALEVDKRDSKSLSGLGMCETMLKNHEKAYEIFLQSLDIQPNELVPILQLLECSYVLGRFDDLERVLNRYLRENPNDVEMQFCLAGCLYKLGRFEESGIKNQEVLSRNPEHRGAKDLERLLAEESAKKKCVGEESKLNKLNWQADPPSMGAIDTRLLGVEDKKRTKNYDEALRDIESIIEEPGLTKAQREKAILLKADLEVVFGRLSEAARCYDNALKENPQCPKALAGKGALAAASGDWVKGKAYFEQALVIDKDFDIALAGMGLWAQFRGELTVAWQYYQKALKKNPENTRALLGVIELGYALNHLEEVEKAVGDYLEMHPGDLDFIYALAGCYFAQNRVDEAKTEVDKITLFQPEHEKALELRDMIEAKINGSNLAL
ncbi:MAG: tetratricopeptide repeat protein [SAR324 cluster bacterium]|uniref:Tetratricopeptide repeat protein n=1 Tax=SAR324 cluster bacterium TaxID=2024889 RepID=A0A7X9IKB5_9DELT|nr:tetratricopeptide repeat protein [SAR324 cluster bacterium]